MNISRLAKAIAESPTFALNEEARILRERGEPTGALRRRRRPERHSQQPR